MVGHITDRIRPLSRRLYDLNMIKNDRELMPEEKYELAEKQRLLDEAEKELAHWDG